jgi:hypothetical protein
VAQQVAAVLVTTTERPRPAVNITAGLRSLAGGRGGQDSAFKPAHDVSRDPMPGTLTHVYEDPSTGKRQYREEPEA